MENILTPEQRRQRNHEEVKASILQIARQLMRENGVAALSFNEIARRMGMKPPSLYTYFDSKMAIYDALFRSGMEMFAERMQHIGQTPGGPAATLQHAFEALFAFAMENPELFQLMFERPVPGFVPSEESMAVSLASLEVARTQLSEVIKTFGLEPGIPLREASDLTIAMIHGLSALHLANDPDKPLGEGRFGSLLGEAAQLFTRAWQK